MFIDSYIVLHFRLLSLYLPASEYDAAGKETTLVFRIVMVHTSWATPVVGAFQTQLFLKPMPPQSPLGPPEMTGGDLDSVSHSVEVE